MWRGPAYAWSGPRFQRRHSLFQSVFAMCVPEAMKPIAILELNWRLKLQQAVMIESEVGRKEVKPDKSPLRRTTSSKGDVEFSRPVVTSAQRHRHSFSKRAASLLADALWMLQMDIVGHVCRLSSLYPAKKGLFVNGKRRSRKRVWKDVMRETAILI